MSPAVSRRSIPSQSAISSTFLLLLVFSLLSPALACQAQDRDALRNIADAFGPNGILNSWTHTPECCQWSGALCDLNSGRVVSLQILGPSDLYGHLSDAIGDLSALTIIKISGHPRLSGPIPPSLSQLPSLQFLDLSGNGFTGTIPKSLSQLKKLSSINLSNNRLTGTIPIFLGSISEAAPDLDLSNNRLSGNIPAELGKPDWRSINLSNNRLCDRIPPSLAKFGQNAFIGNKCLCDDPLPLCP